MTEASSNEDQQLPFGSGLVYSLAHFIAHEVAFRYILAEVEMIAADGALDFSGIEQDRSQFVESTISRLAATRWFGRAVQALRHLVIPKSLPQPLRERLQRFLERARGSALPASTQKAPTTADVNWALDEAKELIRQVDEHLGVPTTKATSRVLPLDAPILRFRD